MIERTLAIIKPDVLNRQLQAEALQDIKNHFTVIAKKNFHFTKEDAKLFYGIHSDKPFFNDLVTNITNGSCIILVLEGEDVIKKYRDKIGPTNPKDAVQGQLRHKYGISIDFNSFHGSDSAENAKKEIGQFFQNL